MAVADAGSGGEAAGGETLMGWILLIGFVLCVLLVYACCWIAGEGR